MKRINLGKVDTGTIVRTIAAFVALVNQFFAISGLEQIPFDDQATYQWLTMGITAITFVINWWKNNSFTEKAQLGDEIIKAVENNRSLEMEIKNIVK